MIWIRWGFWLIWFPIKTRRGLRMFPASWTLRQTRRESIAAFMKERPGTWSKYYRQGFRCTEVNVNPMLDRAARGRRTALQSSPLGGPR